MMAAMRKINGLQCDKLPCLQAPTALGKRPLASAAALPGPSA